MKKKITKILFGITIMLSSTEVMQAQAPLNWTRGGSGVFNLFPGDGSSINNRPLSAYFLSTNESVISGVKYNSYSNWGDNDLYIQKYDANGLQTGTFSFLEYLNYDDNFFQISGGKSISTFDDGSYMTGSYIDYDHGNFTPRSFFIKLNSNLQVIWQVQMTSATAINLAADTAGNLLVACLIPVANTISDQKIQIRKYDGSTGTLLFSLYIKDNNEGKISSLSDFKIDNAGNTYLCGSVYKPSLGQRYLTAKINANGTIGWKKYYDGQIVATTDVANALAIDHNNNIIVTGESYYNGNNFDFFTLKYDANGNILWYKRKDFDNADNRGTNVQIDANNNFFVEGSYAGSNSVVFKYDENGNQIWQKRLSNFIANDFKVSDQGNSYLVSDKHFTGSWILATDLAHIKKLDANGNLEWVYTDLFNLNLPDWSTTHYLTSYTNAAINNNTSEVLAVGYLEQWGYIANGQGEEAGGYDWHIDHFSPTARISNLSVGYITDVNLYPNPVSNQLTLQLKDEITEAQLAIIDLQGREVLTRNLFSINETLDVTLLKSGIYFVRITYNGKVLNKKFVKE